MNGDELSAVKILSRSRDVVHETDGNGRTALAHAGERGHAGIVQLLLAHRAAVNHRCKRGWSPLDAARYWAIKNARGDFDLARRCRDAADVLEAHGGRSTMSEPGSDGGSLHRKACRHVPDHLRGQFSFDALYGNLERDRSRSPRRTPGPRRDSQRGDSQRGDAQRGDPQREREPERERSRSPRKELEAKPVPQPVAKPVPQLVARSAPKPVVPNIPAIITPSNVGRSKSDTGSVSFLNLELGARILTVVCKDKSDRPFQDWQRLLHDAFGDSADNVRLTYGSYSECPGETALHADIRRSLKSAGAALFFSVVEVGDLVAVGLGSNKDKLRRAGYIALTLVWALEQNLECLIGPGGPLCALAEDARKADLMEKEKRDKENNVKSETPDEALAGSSADQDCGGKDSPKAPVIVDMSDFPDEAADSEVQGGGSSSSWASANGEANGNRPSLERGRVEAIGTHLSPESSAASSALAAVASAAAAAICWRPPANAVYRREGSQQPQAAPPPPPPPPATPRADEGMHQDVPASSGTVDPNFGMAIKEFADHLLSMENQIFSRLSNMQAQLETTLRHHSERISADFAAQRRAALVNNDLAPMVSLNQKFLKSMLQTCSFLLPRLDPARDPNAVYRFRREARWFDIDDKRLRNSHNEVSPCFKHGPHAGQRVKDLAHKFMRGEACCEKLTPMVAVEDKGLFYVIFGNRRLTAVKEFAALRTARGASGPTPKIQIIVHSPPYRSIQLVAGPDAAVAFQAKVLDAMSSLSDGTNVGIRGRR